MIKSALLAMLLACTCSTGVAAAERGADPLESPRWADMRKEMFPASARVVFDDKVKVTAPLTAENAMNVPVSVDASALQDVREVLVFADFNPIVRVVRFEPTGAQPSLGFRIKLQQSTPVRAAVRSIYIVPATINLQLVLEAETLIADYLKETGKARFIIEDDESSKPLKVLQFGRSLLRLSGEGVVRFNLPDGGGRMDVAIRVKTTLMFGIYAQPFELRQYSEADASLVAPFDYASMIFALGIGYFVFAEVPTLPMLAGAALIVAAMRARCAARCSGVAGGTVTAGLSGPAAAQPPPPLGSASIATALFKAYMDTDASLAEINPLILEGSGGVKALDAKFNFDANALFRHPEIVAYRDLDEEDPAEVEASKFDLAYISLDGNIGCLVNGAGLAMATMDTIKLFGGSPANFLDVGGGATAEKVTEAFKIMLKNPEVKGILVNIFGGIMKCDTIAEGVITACRAVNLSVPLVVRMKGTNEDLGKKMLAESGLPIIAADTMAEAATKIVAAVA